MVVFFSFWGKAYRRSQLGRIEGVAQALTVFASATGPLLLAWCAATTGSYAAAFYVLAATLVLLTLAALVVRVPAGAGGRLGALGARLAREHHPPAALDACRALTPSQVSPLHEIGRGCRMELTELFLAELDREVARSRRALEQVPEGKPDWKPHEKSMTFGYLADMVATIPTWITMIVKQDELDIAPKTPRRSSSRRRTRARSIVAALDKSARRRARRAAGHERRAPEDAVASARGRQGRRRDCRVTR